MADLDITGRVTVDATQAEGAFKRVGTAADKMSKDITSGANAASKATDGIGSGADKGAQQFTRAGARIRDEITKSTKAIENFGKTASEKLELKISAKGLDRAQFAPYLAELKRVEAAHESVGASVGTWRSSLAQIGPAAAAAFSVAAVVGFAGKLVAVQREFDVLNSSLTTVTGSSAAAQKELEWLKTFAKETPFGLAQATQGFVKMKALGLDPTRASLTSFGNTASAMGKDLNQMIEAVADASTGEFERLKEFGIKAKKQGDEVSLTFQGVTTTIGNNAKEINGYLESIGNNQFAGAMAERAKTLDGSIAALGDSWDELFRTVNTSNAGTLIFDSVTLANGAIEDATTILKALSGAATGAGNDLGALKAVQDGLATVFETVAVLGVNLKYVLVQLGTEIGGLAAQAVAAGSLNFSGVAAIRAAMVADGIAARKEIDATTERILNARKEQERYTANSTRNASAAADPRRTDVAAEVAVAAIKKQGKAAKEAVDEFAKALEKVQAKESGLNSDYASTLSTLYAGYQQGRIGADDYAAAVESLIKQQPFYAAGLKAQAELTKDLATAMAGAQKIAAAYANEADKASEQLINTIAKLADENELIGLNTEARAAALVVRQEQILADTELALLMAQNIEGNETQIKALEREVNLRKQLIAGMREGAAKTAKVDRDKDAADSAKKAADEWQKASDKIEQDLTDALMRGFESGKGFAENLRSTLENMFKTMVLRPVISAIVSPVAGAITGSLGLAGAANAASGASNAASGVGLLSSLGTGLGAGGSMIAGGGIGGWLSASTSLIGTGTAAGAMAGIGALAGPIGAVLAIGSLIKSLDDSGTMHTGGLGSYSKAGGSATGNTVKGQNAGFFNLAQADYQGSTEQASVAMAQALVGMLDSTANTFGKSAGYYAATAFADDTSKDGAWGSLLVKIGDKVVADWGAGGPGYLGREFADGQAGANQYSAAIGASIRDLLIEQTPDWADTMLQALGDAPSIEALAETVGQITATENALQGMGRASQAFANIGDEVAGQLIAAMGGAQAAAQAMAGYYANFYSDTERNTIARTQFAEAAATIGITDLPTTRAGYRDMIDGYMAAGDTERAGKLIQYSGAFASFTDAPAAPNYTAATSAANDLQNAVDKLAEKFANAQASLADTAASLGIELLRAMGDTQGALAAERAQYLAGFADLGQAEQDRLASLYDQNQAIRDQITAAEKAKMVAEERTGLESQILQLQGNTTALRALELAALDEANRPLQEHIYALQDEAVAADKAKAATEKLAASISSFWSAADSAASKFFSGETLKSFQNQRFADQLNEALQNPAGNLFTGENVAAGTIGDIQAAVLAFVASGAPAEAKTAVLQLGASLIDFKQQAIDAADALAKAIGDQRGGLMTRLYTLQENTTELRRAELAALYPANRALQQLIWNLEDLNTEASKAATRTDDAYSALERAVNAQRKAADTTRAAAGDLVQEITGIFDTLKSNIASLYDSVDSTRQFSATQGQAFIIQALAAAKATGALPDSKDLADAISAARSGLDGTEYATQFESDFARLQLAGQLSGLQDASGKQLTEAQRQLKAAEDAAETLDATLQTAKDQIDVLRGIDISVVSVEAAIANLATAIRGESAAKDAAKTAIAASGAALASGPLDAQSAYEASLGLAPSLYGADAANSLGKYTFQDGILYTPEGTAQSIGSLSNSAALAQFQGMFGAANVVDLGSATDSYTPAYQAYLRSIEDELKNLPSFDVGTNYVKRDMIAQLHEGEAVVPKPYNPAAGGAGNNERLERLVQGLTAEVQRLQAIVSQGNEHTGQLASQFDQVSAGGNALATETLV